MIYKLPVAAGLSVSDANQKSLNLNALQALPMTECTGAEYNGVISGWSIKAETPDAALTKAVFVDGDELRFKVTSEDWTTPTINGEELDGRVKSNAESWTLKERQFLDASIIDVSDRVFLRRNIDVDELIFDSLDDESKETIECPRPYIFARLAIGRDVADDIAVSIDAQEIRIYKSTTGIPVAAIAVDDNNARAFADAFCAYKADVYVYEVGGELIFDFVGRGESAESVFYFTLSADDNLVYPTAADGTIASVLWAFFDVADKTGYFLAVLDDGDFVTLVKDGEEAARLGNIISSPGEIASSSGCWSEFEWYYKGSDESGLPTIKRNYITSTGASSDTPAILGTSELIGATGTRAGYIVHTLNGIPSTIEKDGFYIGGFSGEISTAFPDTSDVFLYHSSGRLIQFVARENDFDALITSTTAKFNAVAVSKVKKKMVRLATLKLPAVFDFDSKKFIYTNVAYTGAVEAVISGSPAEAKYKQTAFAALMINEISNTVCAAKILPVHDDIVTGKVKITVRSPKFYGDKYGITDPIFSFFCGQDIADGDDESSAMRTVNIDYLYNFASGTIGYDYSKEGTQFAEGIYNTLLPLPIWAKIREDNPRVADGGNITFFCATNPSAQYRGMGDIGYSNYYVGSSFDSLDSYMFLSGKNFLFKDESVSELLLAANGAISSVSRYIENIKFDYIGQNQSEAFFLSRADKAFYRYTGYFQLVKSTVFSNLPELRKGQYISTIDSLFFYPDGDFKNIYVLRDSKVALAQLFGADDKGGVIAVQESDEHSVKIYTIGADNIPYYTDISLRKEAGYHQQAFRLVSNYVGLPYTELQVKSIALTFYVTMGEADYVAIDFEYRWRYAESAGSESAKYIIRLDDTEVDPSGRRFVRLRFIPQTQKVVDFAVGLSVPELVKDVSELSVEFAGIEVEADAKEKPLIGENWSK